MNISKGWGFALGVFVGFQAAKIKDNLPFIINTMRDIREMLMQTEYLADIADMDDEEEVELEVEEDEGE